MSEIIRDSILGGEVPLAEDETVIAEFRPDPSAYWRGHGILALAGGIAAGIVLVVMGNPAPWVGPLGAAAAILARAAFLRSEAMAARWRLTDRRLLGPALRAIPREDIVMVRPFMGDVQVVTRGGDKHLMKYMADPASVVRMVGGAA
jgi:hypothetical protein